MGKKPILGLAAAVLAGAALSGCQTSRPQTGGPLMSGTTPMMGAANGQNAANAAGLAQNQAGQTRQWNDRGYTNTMNGQNTNTMVPTAGTNYPYNGTTQSYNGSRPATGMTGTPDRSYMTQPNTTSSNSYTRPAGTPSYTNGTATPSYTSGTTPGYPRTTTTTSGNDRMLTNPAAPTYPSNGYGTTTQGSNIPTAMQKPATGASMPPAPAPVSATSPSFGSSTPGTGTPTAPAFTPQSGSSSIPPTGGNE